MAQAHEELVVVAVRVGFAFALPRAAAGWAKAGATKRRMSKGVAPAAAKAPPTWR